MTRKGLTLVLTLLLAVTLGLTACGRKGPLERPKGAEKPPKPGPNSDATVRGPDRPFILDKLLR